jgi:TIR domain
MKIGDRLRPRIDETIRLYDKLLLVLSKTSAASQWVEQEVETALARERQQGTTILFPVRIDNTVMTLETGWPALIRGTHLRRDTVIPQWFQASKATAASDGHAVHC